MLQGGDVEQTLGCRKLLAETLSGDPGRATFVDALWLRMKLLLRLLLFGVLTTTGVFAVSGPQSSKSLWIDAPGTGGSFRFSKWNPLNYRVDPTTVNMGSAQLTYKLPWSSGSVGRAGRLLEAGESSVTVATRAEAEELFLRVFQSRGTFRNTSGMSPSQIRADKFLFPNGKTGTYHFDDMLDAAGRVSGHGAGNAHGVLPHLQVHDFDGTIYRIFFGG